MQAIAGIAEEERGRPVNPLPRPAAIAFATQAAIAFATQAAELGTDPATDFRGYVEAEQIEPAQSVLLGAIEAGWDADGIRPWFAGIVSDHHLSYGHAAIYSQKAFQLLDMIGWERASTVLPYLVPTIVYGTREDKLPYMRPFVKALRELDSPSWRRSNRTRWHETVGCSRHCSPKGASSRCTRPSPRYAPGPGSNGCSTSSSTR